MTNQTDLPSAAPFSEAHDAARRLAVALAARVGAAVADYGPDPDYYTFEAADFYTTGVPDTLRSEISKQVPSAHQPRGLDGVLARVVIGQRSKQILFDVILRMVARDQLYADLQLLIATDGSYWLVPGSRSQVGIYMGRSGLMPMFAAAEWSSADRRTGLDAGLRLLSGEDVFTSSPESASELRF